MKVLYYIKYYVIVFSLFQSFGSFGQSDKGLLKKLVLPSEVKNLSKSVGSVYYSPTVKGKVLIPVHFWGEVARSGLHFVPIDTTLVQGLSMAGGPKSTARLDNIRLSRQGKKSFKPQLYDLRKGGDGDAYNEKLKAGDTIFIERSYFHQNRVFYTGLVGVAATILSSILIYKRISEK